MNMYRVGESAIKRRHHRMELYAAGIIIIVIAVIFARHTLRANTVISRPPLPVTSSVSANSVTTKNFDEPSFSLNLPSDWRFSGHQTNPVNIYTWETTKAKVAGRSLSVYMDTIPLALGVNRAVLVQGAGNKLTLKGDVSDNCASFTSITTGSPPTASPAKWGGADFLCDLGNYERDVVGTVSRDGVNTVSLEGNSGSQHRLFFTYTDNNISPDFSIFLNALQSFKLK